MADEQNSMIVHFGMMPQRPDYLGHQSWEAGIMEFVVMVDCWVRWHRCGMAGLVLATLVCGASGQMSPVKNESPNHDFIGPIQQKRIDPLPLFPPKDNPFARSAVGVIQLGPWTSVQVNVDGAGANIVGDAANEPSLAIDPIDPSRMVVGWRQFDSIASNFRQAGRAYSHDGGVTWTAPSPIEAGIFRSDPVLDVLSDGTFLYYSLTVDNPNPGDFLCQAFRSTDGGVTFGPGVQAFGGDKAWVAVDRTTSIGNGHIYATWQSFFNCCGFNTFTRSVDGGLSFETPVFIPLGPTFGTTDVGPDGEVYVAGVLNAGAFDTSSIVFAKSSNARDAGVTPSFELSAVVEMGGTLRLSSGSGPNPAGLLGQVQIVTDHSNAVTRGNVYMLASLDPDGPDPADMMFVRSEDGGLTWSSPVVVNDDPAGSNNWQWFGAISVGPNGRIDTVWNDTRASGQFNVSELYYAYSFDAGLTWSQNMPISPPFDSLLGFPNQNKLGDYYDIISDEAGASIIYAATFNGEQDVYFLRVGDCDGNGVHDGLQIQNGDADINQNLIPDVCEAGVIPVLSGGSLLWMAGLLIVAGTLILNQRRASIHSDVVP